MNENTIRLSRSIPEVRELIRATFPEYAGRKIVLELAPTVLLCNLNWDGGSRNVYMAVDASGLTRGGPVEQAPWEHAFEGKRVTIPAGTLVVCHGHSCGRDQGIRIYANPAAGPDVLGPRVRPLIEQLLPPALPTVLPPALSAALSAAPEEASLSDPAEGVQAAGAAVLAAARRIGEAQRARDKAYAALRLGSEHGWSQADYDKARCALDEAKRALVAAIAELEAADLAELDAIEAHEAAMQAEIAERDMDLFAAWVRGEAS